MSKKKVYSCYGCKEYYRINEKGEKEWLKPFSKRHCDYDSVWDCAYWRGEGKPGTKRGEDND